MEFLPHFESSMGSLRAALTELFGAVGAEPSAPPSVARSFGIHRNMAWKVCRVVNSVDPVDAIQHVPGRSGLQAVLDAFGSHGAPRELLERVSIAAAEYERMVEIHAGSRAALELMLGSLVPERVDPLVLEASRKRAFQGLSAIWGVQAKTRMAAQIVALNAEDPERVDIAAVSGHAEFRRLRSVTRWPLLHRRNWGITRASYSPIDDSVAKDEAPFMREFCSPAPPDVEMTSSDKDCMYELQEGAVGNTAAFTYAFGYFHRSVAPIRADDRDAVAEHSFFTDTPSEWLVLDLLLHRDLPIDAVPDFAMCSYAHGQDPSPLSSRPQVHLPRLADLQDLGAFPPRVATPHASRLHELLSAACLKLGHPIEEFRGYRFTLSYPPVPMRTAFYYPLAPPT